VEAHVMKKVEGITEFNDDIERKRCGFCKQLKPLEQFSKNKWNPDGLYHYCKTCQRPYQNGRLANKAQSTAQ